MESATSASRRRERVALLTDRAHVGPALARASKPRGDIAPRGPRPDGLQTNARTSATVF
jgi:hypothetical protein